MKRLLAGAVGGAAAIAVIFGAGPAVADNEWKGRTYEQVQGYTNGRAVIASRTGSYLPTEQCVVTGNRRATYGTGGAKILVDLNCNDPMTAGRPGYSVASEQGAKAAKLKRTAASISKDFGGRAKQAEAGKLPYCERTQEATDYCRRVCQQAGSCSDELSEFLGL